jgi:2-haloacid dehalogenase
MTELDFGRFEVLTVDCYGTLIDWEAGLLGALRPVLAAHRVAIADEDLLEAYAGLEAELEAGPYRRYRDVLGGGLAGLGARLGFEPTAAEVEVFGGSVADWPAFEDSPGALARLSTRFRLGVVTNCDNDLFAASSARLGVRFDWVVTAEQVGSYKPNPRNLEVALERIGRPRARVLHVAQSLFHDHVPAAELGLASVWVDRRRDPGRFGATPAAVARPTLTVPDVATLADLVDRADGRRDD